MLQHWSVEAGAAHAGRPRVLIREDDSCFAADLAESLRARGFSPHLFPTRGDVRGAFDGIAPRFLVLGICMPPPDGIEILRFLRDYETNPPIGIFLVSGSPEAMVQAATTLCSVYRLALRGVFRKPTALPALIAALAGEMSEDGTRG